MTWDDLSDVRKHMSLMSVAMPKDVQWWIGPRRSFWVTRDNRSEYLMGTGCVRWSRQRTRVTALMQTFGIPVDCRSWFNERPRSESYFLRSSNHYYYSLHLLATYSWNVNWLTSRKVELGRFYTCGFSVYLWCMFHVWREKHECEHCPQISNNVNFNERFS